MNEIYHIPAMLRETIQGLNIQPDGLYVDVTFGGGGHSRAILEAAYPHPLPKGKGAERREAKGERQEAKGKLFSFDQDLDAYYNAERSGFGNRESGIEKQETGIGNRESGVEKQETGIGNRESGNQQWQFVHSNFRYLRNFMDYYGVEQIDGLLADLGVSFHHFDCPERGFSFRFSAPLDMRMNQTGGKTAADILNTYSEEDLARVLYIYGEMKNSRQIAKKIVKAREKKAIERTEELVALVMGRKPTPTPSLKGRELQEIELDIPAGAKKELAKLFQALRIEVNDEMGALREMLLAAKDLLKPGGRIAILTYHSLEDRIVKNFLRSGNLDGTIEKDFYGNILSPFKVIEKGLTASNEEVERNPRARSAKLRVAEKI
ncbi:MAG: 16S rRNA (cytosine(1402)-N(4))-methyltransferase RsmH [Paludibacteraceae bacterium]|nr:16S rRNA (cytosine(1402)-N(4))-methyltransferase RsmH [Paludibacteraceae bacterium]